MALREIEKLYTVEEFLEIAALPENEDKRLEVEDGVIVEMPASKPINTVTYSPCLKAGASAVNAGCRA